MIDTGSFMIAAYTVATLIYSAYFVSLWLRARRVGEKIAALSDSNVILSEAKDRPAVRSDSSLRSE